MDIKNSLRRNWQYIICVLCIAVALLIPVPFAEITQEENPDDSVAIVLSQNSPIEFDIESLPPKTMTVALWTGDTIRASDDTPLTIQMGAGKEISTTLKDVQHNSRELMLPIDTDTTPLQIKINAPKLRSKDAIVIRTQQTNKDMPAYTVFVRKPFIYAVIEKMYAEKTIANDIEYVWKEGGEILAGKNPYARAQVDTKSGSKYATYFPLSYIASAAIQKIGYTSFDSWMTIMRPLILGSQLFCAAIVLYYLAKKRLFALALLAFFLIIFHRFALYPARVTHIDFPAIALLLAGLILLRTKPRIAYILIGTSLAIKQMAIFIIPILLIYVWQQHRSAKKALVSIFFIALVPLITFAPFIIDNPTGVFRSITYSANRTSTGDFASPDIATMLALDGLWARLPMLVMFVLVYIAAGHKEIRLFGACLAIFTIFIGFNPVLFFQYLAWIIPFIPLAISEAVLSGTRSQSSHQLHDT